MVRDLSRKQFEAKLEAHGFEPVGAMGYWKLPVAGRVCVSEFNGGSRLRSRLAYLLRELENHTAPQGR